MSGGRTTWWAKDSAWWRRERIVELGEEFGPAGPAVIDWLCCEADAQRDHGQVKAGFRALARGCFAGPENAREIVERAAEIGALDDLEVHDRTFTCRVSGFLADQTQARREDQRARAADRQARKRARDAESNGMSRDVTHRHEKSPPTQHHTTTAYVAAGAATVAELFEYWQDQCDHPQAKLTPDRRRKIGARLREGYTPEQIRQAIDGAARAAFVNDDGKKFDDIELICRTGAKLELFIDRANHHGGHQTSAEFVERLNAAHDRVRA